APAAQPGVAPILPTDSTASQPADTTERLPYAFRPMGNPQQIRGYGGMTALALAAREGNIEAAVELLDGGAEINRVTGGEHTSPLLMAAINGHFDLAMVLLDRGADPNLASDAGETPLFATISTEWSPTSRPPPPTDYLQQ